jgi:NAD(P)-dependent dehydrogenase (short-subunit alcohol dehydrogenase family)
MRDKVVIVSGGAGGIGSEISRRMASEGGTVLVADINLGGAEAVAAGIGNGSSAVYFDAYDANSIQSMVQTSVDRYGKLNILINNVADTGLTMLDKTVLDTEIETFDRSIAANLRSLFIATKAALPYLLAAGRGAIVNISSASALFGDTWLVSYSSAKAAVIELTRNTAVQYGRQGIRCNSICPGFIAHGKAREMMADTLRSALEASYVDRNGAPEDIAALATFLASDEAGFINGENVVCDGGHTVGATPWRSGTLKAV